jgi:transcriptional regulator with XRE-family HTH domain
VSVSQELEAFRDRLKRALATRGVTQSELARRLDVRQATISQWFSQEAPAQPKAQQILRLPAVLEINGHWLLTGQGGLDDRPTEAQVILEGIRRILDTPRKPPRPDDEEAVRRSTRAHSEAGLARQHQTSLKETPSD